MPLNTPVAPTLDTLTSTGFKITVNADGNPGGTNYSFRVVFGSTTQYVNSGGLLQTTKTFFNVPNITITNAIPNTFYTVALSAASDALGTDETSYGSASTTNTLAALPTAKDFKNVFSSTLTTDWDANGNPTGTEYYVQIAQDSDFTTGVVNSGWNGIIGYQFTVLLPLTRYYARVKARNEPTVETAYVSLGSTVTKEAPDTVKVIQVFNLLASRAFLIKWAPALETDIASYNVYRSSSPTDNASFSVIGTTVASVNSFIDQVPFTFGIVFYYKVTSVDAAGNESSIIFTNPSQDNTFHSFEEQPFAVTVTTNSFVTDEIPTGSLNGINHIFTTLSSFRLGTLNVYLNGAKLYHTLDFTETAPQTFTLVNAPISSDKIVTSYIKF